MTNKIPNPYGRKGGPEHQDLVQFISEDIEKRGLNPIREFFLNLLGIRKKRFVDVVAKDGENIVEMHQVGKINKNGKPIKRERDVIQEIKSELDVDVIFHPYNKSKGNNNENKSN